MAADGVVDFREAVLLDRRWTLRLKWLSGAYATRKRADVAAARHIRYTAALGTDDAKLFERAWGLSGQTLDELDALLRPWLDRAKGPAAAGGIEQALDTFKRVIGDMNDPEFRARTERIAAQILKDAGMA